MPGNVQNQISGGTTSGPVVQAGSIGSITFGAASASVPVEVAIRDPRPVFASVLANGFTGRDWLIGRVDAFLERQPCGYVWVEADAGMGKTALVAHLARSRGWISHFARYANGGSMRVGLQNLAGQLIDRYDLWHLAPGRLVPEWAFTPEGFEALVAQAADGGRRVVLLVDGADEAVTAPDAQPWGLPSLLPTGVYVIGTYRTGSAPARCDAPRAVLRLAADDPHNQEDLRSHLRRMQLEDDLAAVDVPALTARCGGVWVYLRYVLDEIRLGLRNPQALGDLPGDLHSYYLAQLAVWRKNDHWHDVVLPVLATLAAAGEAVPLDVLSRMSGAAEHHVQRWCHGRLRPFLSTTSSSPRRFEIYHASLREMMTSAAATSEEERAWSEVLGPAVLQAHSRIADRCLVDADHYALRHLVTHLLTAGRDADLDALLRNEDAEKPRWFTAHEEADTLDLYLADLRAAWGSHAARTDSALDEGATAPSLLHEIRVLLMIASITSLTGTISMELLVALTSSGVWSPRRVLSHVRRQETPSAHVLAITAVLPHLPAELHDDVLSEAIAVVNTIEAAHERCLMSVALAPHLSEEQMARTVTDALGLVPDYLLPEVLAGLAPHLSAAQLSEAFTAVLELGDDYVKCRALIGLAPRLSAEQLDLVMAAVAGMSQWSVRDVLIAIAPRLELRQLDEAHAIARTLDDAHHRVATMVKLIDHLQGEHRPKWIASALADAAEVENDRLKAMTSLVAHLSAAQVAELRAEINEVEDDADRASLLAALAPRLSREGLAEALSAALGTEGYPTGEYAHVGAVLNLAPWLPQDMLGEALDVVWTSHRRTNHDELLIGLAPLLSAGQLTRATGLAGSLPDARARVRAALGIASHLPTRDLRATAVKAALATAVRISPDTARVDASTMLLPHLAETARRALLDEIVHRLGRELDDRVRRPILKRIARHATADELLRLLGYSLPYWLLAEVAPHVTPDVLVRIVDAVVRLRDQGARGDAIRVLAPLLPAVELDRALASARTITNDDYSRGRALVALTAHVPIELRAAVAAEALAAIEVDGDLLMEIKPVITLMPNLSRAQLLTVLAQHDRLPDLEVRGILLSELVTVLPDDELHRIEAVLPSLDHSGARTRVLGRLALRQPPERRTAAYARVLTEIENADDDVPLTLSEPLDELAPHWPVELHDRLLAVMGRFRREDDCAHDLTRLGPHLRADLVDSAIGMAESLSDAQACAHALTGLLHRLPADRQRLVVSTVLEKIREKIPEEKADQELARLAPQLPADLLMPACNAVFVGQTEGLAALLARAADLGAHQDYVKILRLGLRTNERETCLRILDACLPTLSALAGPATGARLKETLDDIYRWWP